MNILHLAYRNSSGVPGRWAEAHRRLGHTATLLVELDHPFRFQGAMTVMRWTSETTSAADRVDRLAPLLRKADAVMAYDHPYYLDAAIASGKPVLFRALGQSAREYAAEIRELLTASNVVRASAGLAELAMLLDIELTGAPHGLLSPATPSGELVLCHAPSDRIDKQTATVLRAAAATGWRVELVEGASHAEALRRKRRCALVVDSGPGAVPDGYGVNSIEAMAMGLPAVAGASPRVRERMREAGSPVVLVNSTRELARELRRLTDSEARRVLGAAGREFVKRFHAGRARALEDVRAVGKVAVAA